MVLKINGKSKKMSQLLIEQKIKKVGPDRVIYLDECAAGVLAGDLFVCGIMMPAPWPSDLGGVGDSKKMTESRRSFWFPLIQRHCLDVELVRITPQEVDRLNILQARMEGFRRAIEALAQRQNALYAVVDGSRVPESSSIPVDALIKADALIPGVSCASIFAKHLHTEYMKDLCLNPKIAAYGFANHKGYGTQEHMEKLKEFGPIEGFHRFSYRPVRESIKK